MPLLQKNHRTGRDSYWISTTDDSPCCLPEPLLVYNFKSSTSTSSMGPILSLPSCTNTSQCCGCGCKLRMLGEEERKPSGFEFGWFHWSATVTLCDLTRAHVPHSEKFTVTKQLPLALECVEQRPHLLQTSKQLGPQSLLHCLLRFVPSGVLIGVFSPAGETWQTWSLLLPEASWSCPWIGAKFANGKIIFRRIMN